MLYDVVQVAGFTYLCYWLFFGSSTFPLGIYLRERWSEASLDIRADEDDLRRLIGTQVAHQGDWEGITIRVADRPLDVHFRAHGADVSPIPFDAVKREGSRTVVYCAKGSHASYASPPEAEEHDDIVSADEVRSTRLPHRRSAHTVERMAQDPLEQPEEAIRRLYAYVAYRIGSGPDAEDVVSDTVERALRYRDSYEPSAGSPIGWMIGIANRCIADALAAGGRRAVSEAGDATGMVDDFAGGLADRADLQAAMALLDERDRELLALRYGADLPAREIGRVLGMRTNAVEVALHRALGRLRRKLEPDTP